MALLKFIGLFTLSHGGNDNQQGAQLMWRAAICLAARVAPSCSWAEL